MGSHSKHHFGLWLKPTFAHQLVPQRSLTFHHLVHHVAHYGLHLRCQGGEDSTLPRECVNAMIWMKMVKDVLYTLYAYIYMHTYMYIMMLSFNYSTCLIRYAYHTLIVSYSAHVAQICLDGVSTLYQRKRLGCMSHDRRQMHFANVACIFFHLQFIDGHFYTRLFAIQASYSLCFRMHLCIVYTCIYVISLVYYIYIRTSTYI